MLGQVLKGSVALAGAVAVVGFSLLGTCGTAQAEDRIEKRLWVQAGKGGAVQIDAIRELREDCTLAPAPTVTVLDNPKVGKLKVSTAVATGKTQPNGPYAACDGKKFNWTKVAMPVPSKEGKDTAVFQVQDSLGDLTTYDVEVVVTKKLPQGKTHGLYEDR